MKTTGRVFNKGLAALAIFFLTAVPLTAQGELKVNQTTIGGPDATKLCVRDYGETVAEAFEAGTRLIQVADSKLGAGKHYGNVRIRILPEKENGLFVVEVFSFPDRGLCPLTTGYTTAGAALR